MADSEKLQNYLWGLTLSVQLLLHFVWNEYAAVIVPALLATIPNIYLLSRSKNIAKMAIPRGVTAIVVGCIVWGLAGIALISTKQTLISQIVRAVLVYAAILYPVRLIAITHFKKRLIAA